MKVESVQVVYSKKELDGIESSPPFQFPWHGLSEPAQLGFALLHKFFLAFLLISDDLMLFFVGHRDDGKDQVDKVEGTQEDYKDKE